MQHALFDDLPGAAPQPPHAADATPVRHARQRWWRLRNQARRDGRAVEPLLVTPRLLQRIAQAHCPVTREPLGDGGGRAVALRADADIAAGHLALLGERAAAVPDGDWQAAWHTSRILAERPGAQACGLDAAAWRRLALLRSFVAGPTPAEAAELPLHVLPPPRLRVLSAVQALQVALTMALADPRRAARLSTLSALAADASVAGALRSLALTLLARAPAVDVLGGDAATRRRALEDLWDDALLARRWRRLAERLDEAAADALLDRAQRQRLLVGGWRRMDRCDAIDGWSLTPQRLQ